MSAVGGPVVNFVSFLFNRCHTQVHQPQAGQTHFTESEKVMQDLSHDTCGL